MEFLLYASALIAALSLVLIAIAIVVALKSVKHTMGEVSDTLKRVETKIGGITEKSEQLLEETTKISEDAASKIQAFNNFASSAQDLSHSTNYVDQSIEKLSKKIANPPKKHTEIMQQVSTLTEVAARIYFSFKREKDKV